MYPVLRRATSQFLQVAVKALKLSKKANVEGILIENANRVGRVKGRYQGVSCRLNGLEMPWGNIASNTDYCEVHERYTRRIKAALLNRTYLKLTSELWGWEWAELLLKI